MIKLSIVKTYKEIAHSVNEPHEEVGHEVEKHFIKSICFDTIVVTRQPKKVKIWDLKNIPEINMIAAIEIDWSGDVIKKAGNLLYIGEKKAIKVFDLSNLSHPVLVRTVEFNTSASSSDSSYENFSIADDLIYVIMGQAIYTIDNSNTFRKIVDLSKESPMMFDYPMDIKKEGKNLYLVFRHMGLYVYEKSDDEEYKFISSHKPVNGYTPTYIDWLNPGKDLLLIGNDNVVQYDVTNGEKLKRYKAVKIGKTELYEGIIERENEWFIIGQKLGTGSKFVGAVLQSDKEGIQLVNTPTLEYKPRQKYGEKLVGFTLNSNYLLVIAKETGFFLFEAQE